MLFNAPICQVCSAVRLRAQARPGRWLLGAALVGLMAGLILSTFQNGAKRDHGDPDAPATTPDIQLRSSEAILAPMALERKMRQLMDLANAGKAAALDIPLHGGELDGAPARQLVRRLQLDTDAFVIYGQVAPGDTLQTNTRGGAIHIQAMRRQAGKGYRSASYAERIIIPPVSVDLDHMHTERSDDGTYHIRIPRLDE